MCDTVIATGAVTTDGITIFGKNSDREPNEAHHLIRVPRTRHAPGSMLRCTYIDIPEVEETFEVLLAKPYWIWGAEMGSNEFGVTIGNEAVFTRIPCNTGAALTGMDFLRLALERSRTAYEALQLITRLLEEYGQGGNCGHTLPFYYHNSFIIADPSEAWVLETADRHWAAERVNGVRTISNGITIGNRWDMASADLVSYASEKGWCKGAADFHFARCYSDPLRSSMGECVERQCQTTDMLTAQKGKIAVETVMQTLRYHVPGYHPTQGITGNKVCMHAGWGPVRGGQTTGSMVSHLHPEHPTHFVTATAAPCTSLFKPVWLGMDAPDTGPEPTGTVDEATLFWRHEALHRETMKHYDEAITLYATERDTLEWEFTTEALRLAAAPLAEREAYTRVCFTRGDAAEREWLERVRDQQRRSSRVRQGVLYRQAWGKWNKAAKMLV